MKYYILILFNLFLISAYCQESKHIKGKKFDGYIFDKIHFVFMSIENQKERYTPSSQDIFLSEALLRDSINSMQVSINKRMLKKYVRQYVGFITNNDEIVVFIKFFKKSYFDKTWLSNDVIDVMDGGSDFWSIFVNVTKRELYDLQVNGIS